VRQRVLERAVAAVHHEHLHAGLGELAHHLGHAVEVERLLVQQRVLTSEEGEHALHALVVLARTKIGEHTDSHRLSSECAATRVDSGFE
jgi:hypothetical protein